MTEALVFDKMPFKSIEKHDQALIRSCKERAKLEDVKIYDKKAFQSNYKIVARECSLSLS